MGLFLGSFLGIVGSACAPGNGSTDAAPPDLASRDLRSSAMRDLGVADLLTGPDLADAGAMPDLADGGLRYYAINHILSTGQSLSVGAVGAPALSVTQPYDNRMFNTGVLAGGANLVGFVPLVESGVETMSAGMANLITKMAREDLYAGRMAPENSHDVLVSGHGIGGTPYSGLKKGTGAYANGMAQAAAARSISARIGVSHVVRAVTLVHGESDHVANNANYDNDLLTWQSDYETDVQALTGQREPIPMFETQISSWTRYNSATSMIPGLQLAACDKRPDKMFMVGPKYFLSYVADGVHLDNKGYRWMGEYYAKAYRKVVLEGGRFVPVRPTSASLAGSEISVVFNVPVPPLAMDTILVTNPGNNGFEYWDDSGSPPAISMVALDGPDRVKVTLARAPTGKGKHIRYAYTAAPGALAGATTGARGNLRDSDATVSPSGNKLYNWAVHFDFIIP